MKVSFFDSVKNTAPKINKDVSFFLDRIREGASKDLIATLRATTDVEKQQELKKQLPIVCFNGFFSSRAKAGLKKSSGLMVLDFDHIKDLEKSTEFKELLKLDNHIFSAWISPRFGVKALYRIIDVEDDLKFKSVFEQVKEKYPDLDDSGKDISRATFESYDPEIYINLDAEIFIPEIRFNDVEEEDISVITNLPLTDKNEVANKLIKWFQGKYDKAQRNNSIFKLASAFNDYGVDYSSALNFCGQYAQKGFDIREITQCVASAYRNSANFNTKQFEDKAKKKKLKGYVIAGKTFEQIKSDFEDVPDERLELEINQIKDNLKINEFWDFEDEKPLVNHYKFKLFLESLNYFKYYPVGEAKPFIFINKDENFIQNISEFQIKDKVTNDLLLRNEVNVFNVMAENTKLFSMNYLSMIETANVEVEKDGKDYAMLYFENIAVKVSKDKTELINYEDLNKYIWKEQVINRQYKEVDHHDSMFRKFIWLISGKDVNRYNTFKSVLGYLLHSYKTSANSVAIVLNDEIISDVPNGGSGKSLVTKAVEQMKKVSIIDGKSFDNTKSFAYQTVSTDCQVLAFDDVKKNFNFESLFSIVTQGMTIEYKNQGAIKLSVEDSPKILISTNYTIKSQGGSFERRLFEVELSNYFGAHYSPLDEFGCLLFQEWDEMEWARFDEFMINCIKYYLEHGLKPYEYVNLQVRKLINLTSNEFYIWMTDKNFSNGQRIDYKFFFESFVSDNEDFKKWLTQREFNKWLKAFFEFKNYEMSDVASNGKRFYEIRKANQPIEDINVIENPDLPF